jgi:protein O-GlcNAc transferase
MPISDALKEGLHHHTMGRLDRAARIYEQILATDPSQSDAWHLLGLIWSSRGEHLRGAEMIRKAILLVPNNSVFYGNLGVLLKFGGDLSGAVDAYKKALEIDPTNSDHLFHLGKAYRAAKDDANAESAFRESIRLAPDKSSSWLSLINLLADQTSTQDGLSFALSAVEKFPNNADILLSTGAIYRRSQQLDRAVEFYERTIQVSPKNVDALCRLATIYFSQHDYPRGQLYLNRAESLEPNSHHVLLAAGMMHNGLGNSTLAVDLYQRSISIKPDQASSHANLASALKKQGRLSEALVAVRKSLSMESKSVESRVVEASILLCLGQHTQAEESFRNAIERRGGYRDAHDGMLMCQQYMPGVTSKSLFLSHREWKDRYCEKVQDTFSNANREIERERRPIKLGFVSADLGAHPVGYFAYRLFEHLNRSRMNVTVYSDRLGSDFMTDRMKGTVDAWNETAGLSDGVLLQKIRDDRIDILFDLAGHTAQNRLMLFAERGAPVQMTWAGYVGTTGLDTIDYILADPHQISPEMEAFYSEKVLRMPHGYVTFFPPTDAPDVGPLPIDRNGYITFGAMCNPAKVNDQVVALWKEILTAVPNSRFLLCYSGWPDSGNQDRICQQLADPDLFRRFSFDYTSGPTKTMDAYNRVDICLDTFPYSGGLTTCEAMYMGVPTVTLEGNTFAGRHSLSHLMNVGLREMVAGTKEEYVGIAVSLAKDLPRLRATRLGLRDRVLGSPLCNGPLFAKDFGDLMLSVWKR